MVGAHDHFVLILDVFDLFDEPGHLDAFHPEGSPVKDAYHPSFVMNIKNNSPLVEQLNETDINCRCFKLCFFTKTYFFFLFQQNCFNTKGYYDRIFQQVCNYQQQTPYLSTKTTDGTFIGSYDRIYRTCTIACVSNTDIIY